MKSQNIRNFSIIAHIDHGKSTLSDRMLELTKTIEKRKMQDRVLDSMELERERGITIKMQPVSMEYKKKEEKFLFNLIDTPGHVDFYYEVSRSLKAVEGAILLVDATQGIQAQTLSVLEMAKKEGLKIIGALSKVDSPLAKIQEVKEEISILLDCDEDEIIETSGKTGEGIEKLFDEVIGKIPSPENENENKNSLKALIFDFKYHPNKGIIVFVRIFSGKVTKGKNLFFANSGEGFKSVEVGIFSPEEKEQEILEEGSIGYIVTGIKKAGVASVGDTIVFADDKNFEKIEGYSSPMPVVWASVFPQDSDDFDLMLPSLEKLSLSDSSFSYEPEKSGALGRGFRLGFLGMLHLEILTERLKREFDLDLIVTHPTINYLVKKKSGEEKKVYNPSEFPDYGDILEITEPWINIKIISPSEYSGAISQLFYEHEGILEKNLNFGDGRGEIFGTMPLREMMRGFFDKLKSKTSGFASFSYKLAEYKKADVVKMEILLADEVVSAFTKIVGRARVEEEGKKSVEKLHEIIPRQNFAMKVQAKALGRIFSSKAIKAFRKDVTAKLYGGDITRKRKLLKKQKKGKKKSAEFGMKKVNIPNDVFIKMIKND